MPEEIQIGLCLEKNNIKIVKKIPIILVIV